MSAQPDGRHEHHCQRADDLEAELRNRELFGKFALSSWQPPVPEPRRGQLVQLAWRYRDRTRQLEQLAGTQQPERDPELSEPVDLWPRHTVPRPNPGAALPDRVPGRTPAVLGLENGPELARHPTRRPAVTLLDYSAGVIPGAAIRAAGYGGALRYVDDPAAGLNAKHIRPAEYADLIRAGCHVMLVFEVGTNDIAGGFTDGVAHARRAQAGVAWLGYTGPIFMACDEHVTPDQITVGIAYLDGAASVLGVANVGAYGFPEFIAAAHAGGHASWFWQCGNPPVQPSPVHLWQDNTTADVVAGIACDINRIIAPLAPLPTPAMPSLHRPEDPVSAIEITVKPDGTFHASQEVESGGGSQVVAQAWLDIGSTYGGSSFRATALDPNGAVLAVWPAGTPGGALGHVPNNTSVEGIVLPAGTATVTVEGRIDTPGAATLPAASVMSKAR